MYRDSTLPSFSPISGEEMGNVPIHDAGSLEHVIRSCRRAQNEWVSTSRKRKVTMLTRLLQLMTDRSEEICATVSKETGKPLAEAMSNDLMASLGAVDYCMGWLKRHPDSLQIHQGGLETMMRYLGRKSYVSYRPLGVVGVIAPFNFPLAIPFSQTVMAVACGNGVVIKPSAHTPLSGQLVEELFQQAGFPEGLVKAVSGPGTGRALAASDVDRVVFTGSSEVGRKVMESAAQRLTPVTLELGGKDPMIVLEDADIERAASGALWGAFVNSGQVCVAVKRILLHKDVYSHFLDLLLHKMESLRQGDGLEDPSVSVGAMIDEDSVGEMEDQVRRAVEQGGRVLAGGSRPEGMEGSFFMPTVVADLPPGSDLWKEETFGPVVVVAPFEGDVDAVKLANDSPFALSASVWTKDLERGKRVASALRAGTVVVNNVLYTYGLPATPWGGRDESGFGRTHGQWGMMELMEPHHVHVDNGKFPRDLWWSPYDEETLEHNRAMMDALYREKGLAKVLSLLRLRKGLKKR